MQRWIVGAFLCLAVAYGAAQDDEASRANALWQQGKRLDALPLYEDLYKANPSEWQYAERLAVGLSVKADHVSDPASI